MAVVDEIADLSVWFIADDITGLSDGDPVSTWPDASANGYDLTATTTARPAWYGGVVNGHAVTRWNGTSNAMTGSAPTGGAAQTRFAVFKPSATGANQTLVAGGDGDGSAALQWYISTSEYPSLNSQATAVMGSASSTVTTSDFQIIACTWDDSSNAFTFRSGSAADGSGTYGSSLTARTMMVGNRIWGTEYLTGDLAELITYTRVLNSTEIADVEAYLDSKYLSAPSGVTGTAASNLPALTQAATGSSTAPAFTGTAASTLGALTQSAQGTYLDEYFDTYSGDIGTILPALTQAAAGTSSTPTATGAGASTLPALTQTVAGTHTPPAFTGAASSVLAAIVQIAAGTTLPPEYTGAAASTLPTLTQAGAGAVDNPEGAAGTAATTLPALTQAAAGTRTVPAFTGEGATTLPALEQAANGTAGTPTATGTATSTLPALTQVAAGTHTAPIYTAVIATILPALTQAARDGIRRDAKLTATGPRGRRWEPIGPRS